MQKLSVGTRPSGRQFSLLGFLLFLELAVLLVLVKTRSDIEATWSEWLHPHKDGVAEVVSVTNEHHLYDPKRDPTTGTPAPEWSLRTLSGNNIQISDFMGHEVVLVFAGNCTSCTLRQLQPMLHRRDSTVDDPVLLVTKDDRDGATWLQSQVGKKAAVLDDPNGATAHLYNALWQPRTYIIDAHGILQHFDTYSSYAH
jgi:peroxiredoxin